MPDSKKGLGKSLFSAAGLGLVLLILIFVNIIFSQFSPRWDATADRMYSLSDSTIGILSDLKEEVTIKVFYSQDAENAPVHLKTYARRVLDFISEYEYHGDQYRSHHDIEVLPGGNVLMIGRVLYFEFNANVDWPVASAVAIALLLVLVLPMMLYQHIQAREVEAK